jgi:beta-lactamase regulating signal transducer with metallopeptidase domain
MNFLYHSAFAEALGWSLIDSLWQMGAIWISYIMLTGNGSRFSSQKRHTLALAGSTIGTLVFFSSFIANCYTAVNNNHFFSLSYFIEKQAGASIIGYAIAGKVIPFISFLYVPAVMFFGFRLILQVSVSRHLYRKNLPEANDKIGQFVRDMSERSGIVKKVTVWISEEVESPLTIGFWKPIILFPIALFSHLSCRQVEAVIMHELHHIKRNDYIINIFLSVAGVVLFFNPFARMIFATVKRERENSCDDYVIASGFDPWEYSHALYLLGRYRNEKSNLAIAATGEGREYLLQRIRRIVKRNNPSPSVLKPLIAFFLCLFVAGFATRNKQVVTLPDVSIKKIELPPDNNNIAPVVYFSEETQIIIIQPEKTTPRKKPNKVPHIKNKTSILTSPEPRVQEELSTEQLQDLLGNYVVAPQVLEFTIIDPVKPEVPGIICETPQPYIQKSSFYFTEIDTKVGKKVVEL